MQRLFIFFNFSVLFCFPLLADGLTFKEQLQKFGRLDDIDEITQKFLVLLEKYKEKAIPILHELAKDPKEVITGKVRRVEMLKLLALKGLQKTSKKPLAELIPYFEESSIEIERELIEMFATLKDPKALPTLKTVPKQSENYYYACYARYLLGEREALPEIVATLKHTNPRIREYGYGILTKQRIKRKEVFAALAKEQDLPALIFGIQCVGDLGDKKINPFLVSLLNHRDSFVRKNAIEALRQINEIEFGFHHRKSAAENAKALQKWNQFQTSSQ